MNGSRAIPFPAVATAGMRWLAAIVASCLALAVVMLVLRRLMGALAAPLPAGFLAATLVVALAASVLLRLSASTTNHATRWGPTILLVLLASSLWLPGTGVGGALLLVGAIIGDVAVAISVGSRNDATREPSLRLAANISQQFTRRTSEGVELIEGQVRTTIGPGQRVEYCHIAFCPPLCAVPRVTCQQIEGPPARIKVAQVFRHGARIELRLEAIAAEETAVMLQIQAASAHQPRTQA
jgi:hypothetical protein